MSKVNNSHLLKKYDMTGWSDDLYDVVFVRLGDTFWNVRPIAFLYQFLVSCFVPSPLKRVHLMETFKLISVYDAGAFVCPLSPEEFFDLSLIPLSSEDFYDLYPIMRPLVLLYPEAC